MPYTVLTNTELNDEIRAMLRDTCQVHVWAGQETDPALLQRAEGFFVYGHPKIDGAIMDRMPNLRVISNFGVGVDHINLDDARARGIAVGNTPGLVDGATADMTFALLMAIARNVVIGDRYARSPQFTVYDPNILHGYEVYGTTLGIVGMGNIGRQVARRARGFDMRILYHNRRPNPQAEAELGATYASLEELLAQADYVTLNVPLTPETRHLIGREQLRQMKPTAFLINVARGGVVDHDALVEALTQGWIAGAALDVTEPEPLPRDHPLLRMENVVIAPHLGSATRQTRYRMARRAVDNLLAGLRGEPLPSRIA
ncbi:D-glycerate dehydrogenase [Litorilinea aerophila]|uniref:D-glycerate dehydrogenase n=1 Tax=Litorilinea aerophila TaxID=1204385 RepID=A0A540VDC8_9CHLR|nr:D-glycerate dehydrogenase [Litorilinea aerophila]MCC9077438.1 D-glycerate dehydrogenase [Litorilinea aerophila]OUC05915.1 glyoxylate reductase [Litorilinea aerophila]GIV77589.1 MAG: D-glycerate dehydrogenase [Litorilinea sp.]